jgi:hypothetical protein
VLGDIHARFSHDFNGMRVHAVLLEAGGIGFDHIAFQMARPAFRHLAAAGIAGAEEQDFYFLSWF